mmetsp:Transcript_16364/g.15678  ORF Transcript_16364/g.15678 Transcript_16364/m.15678 type:complete len:334 (-) Transcript_16364:445-1446(-)
MEFVGQSQSKAKDFFLILSHDDLLYLTYYLSYKEFVSLYSTSKKIITTSIQSSYWENFVKSRFLPEDLPWDVYSRFLNGYKTIDLAIQIVNALKNKGVSTEAALRVYEVSSVDREQEGGFNVLKASKCQTDIQRFLISDEIASENIAHINNISLHFQVRCGCAGSHPCYWSSKPSPVQNRKESMLFELKDMVFAIVGFSIIPYQAFFHPDCPVYAPIGASLQFVTISKSSYSVFSEEVYFETDIFLVQNKAILQDFHLPLPMLALNGYIRIVFHGMQQRQTIDEINEYYMCLSRVSIHGIPITPSLNESLRYDSCSDEESDGVPYASKILENL